MPSHIDPVAIAESVPFEIDDTDDDALDQFIDYSDIEATYQVTNEHDFDNILVVDNVPIVDESKKDKLLAVLKKRFGAVKANIRDDGMTMPMAEDPKTKKMMSKGFLFVEFESPQDAERALKTMQGHALDKNHSLFLNKFTDVSEFADVDEEWDELAAVGEEKAFAEKEYLKNWLMDPRARDQFVVVERDRVSIAWNNKSDNLEVSYSRENWSEGWVSWSPRGSYLATFHRLGIALWGGPKFAKIDRFMHPFVQFMEFSPCEKYLVTMSAQPLPAPTPNAPWTLESVGHTICVWDIATGALARTFPPATPSADAENRPPVEWPVFKWSWDDKYFARLVPGEKIAVYETPSMGLVDKKSISLPGVTAFEWAPYKPDPEEEDEQSDPKKKAQKKTRQYPYMIAYYVPPKGNDQPAQLGLMSIPQRQTIRQKQVFYVTGCRIHFQDNGDYLIFSLQRTNRTGKSLYHSLESFRLKEKDFPSDTVEIQEMLVAFSWEPSGSRFAVITTSDQVPPGGDMKAILGGTVGKMGVSFYEVEGAQEKRKGGKTEVVNPGGVKLLKSIDRKSVNSLFWSPKGRFIVLAGLRNLTSGELEFWDLNAADGSGQVTTTQTTSAGINIISKKEVEPIQMIGSAEHYAAGQVMWDPTGRYVMTAVTYFMRQMDNAFNIWDFKGALLSRYNADHLKQVSWRPRPLTLLTKQKQKQIRRTLKEYSKEFEEEDASASFALSEAELAERKRLIDEWYAWRRTVEKEHKNQKMQRRKIRHGAESDDEGEENEVEELVEEVVEETEEIVD